MMKILVYSAMNAETVVQNFGEPEYSYYFVLREFMPLLQQFGDVQRIEEPERQVDPLYHAAIKDGQACVFLSFSPPHLTCLGLACPTIPVFAWEFSGMPNETWWEDSPQQDWSWCLQQCAGAIVHSRQSAAAISAMMGDDFPVAAIPAPLWDRMQPAGQPPQPRPDSTAMPIRLERGALFDTHAPDVQRWLPTEQELIRDVAESRGELPAHPHRGYRRGPRSLRRITAEHMVSWYHQVLAPRLSEAKRSEWDQWATRTDPWQLGRRQLQLSGVVFTSLFNPLDGRKNWADMINAFCTTFHNEPDATLVLKLGHRDHQRALQLIIKELPRLGAFRCRVVIMHGLLDDNGYRQLLHSSHFAVNTSHGEGQCLPLMEYLASGKPAIAPRHSALADYIDEDLAFVINSWAEVTYWPHDPRLAYRTLRQQIDWASLCTAYRQAFECYRQHPQRYQQMSHTAVERLRGHCSVAVAATRLKTLFHLLSEKHPHDTQLVARPQPRRMATQGE